MERIDNNKGSAYDLRVYTASSIHDIKQSLSAEEEAIRSEQENWLKSLGIPERIHENYSKSLRLLSPDTFTYLILPNGNNRLPKIDVAPRALIKLPPVSGIPNKETSTLEITDLVGSLKVEFPYGVYEKVRKRSNCNLNRNALMENTWTSRVMILSILGYNRHFLMHVHNDKANEKSKSRILTQSLYGLGDRSEIGYGPL